MSLAEVKVISSSELRAWRVGAQRQAAENRDVQYARSWDPRLSNLASLQKARAKAVAGAERPVGMVRTDDGSHAVATPLAPNGPPLDGRTLLAKMVARKVAGVERLMRHNPEAKMDIIQHLRATRPGLLGAMSDDEAYRFFHQVIENEMRDVSRRALMRAGRHHTVVYGSY